jgi:hypothetical protein
VLVPDLKIPSRATTRSSLHLAQKLATVRVPANSPTSFSSQALAFRRIPLPPRGSSLRSLCCGILIFTNPCSVDGFPCLLLHLRRTPPWLLLLHSFSGHRGPWSQPSQPGAPAGPTRAVSPLLHKSYWTQAKRVNGGGHCNRLQSKVTVNRDFTEVIVLPTSVNPLTETNTLGCPPSLIVLKK